MLEKPLRELGCNIYRIPQLREDFRSHVKELTEILTRNRYDAVHDHSGYKAWCNLIPAKKCKVPVRIAHSHQAYMTAWSSYILFSFICFGKGCRASSLIHASTGVPPQLALTSPTGTPVDL